MNKICDLLPLTVRTKWDEVFYQLDRLAKVNPFDSFNAFLYRERDIVDRHAEKQKEEKKSISHGTDSRFDTHDDRNSQSHHGEGSKKQKSESGSKFFKRAVLEHKKDTINHNTEECEVFKKYSLKEKLAALGEVRACFRCFENHQRKYCKAKEPCSTCSRTNHHSLMCRDDSDNDSKNEKKVKVIMKARMITKVNLIPMIVKLIGQVMMRVIVTTRQAILTLIVLILVVWLCMLLVPPRLLGQTYSEYIPG